MPRAAPQRLRPPRGAGLPAELRDRQPGRAGPATDAAADVQLVDCTGGPYDLVAAGDPRTWADLVKPKGLRFIAGYADGIGPCKDLLIPRNTDRRWPRRRR